MLNQAQRVKVFLSHIAETAPPGVCYWRGCSLSARTHCTLCTEAGAHECHFCWSHFADIQLFILDLSKYDLTQHKGDIMTDQTQITEFLVECRVPELLDDTLAALPGMTARVVGRGTPHGIAHVDGYPVVRVFGDPGWFKFAVEQQGYCKIIKQLEKPI